VLVRTWNAAADLFIRQSEFRRRGGKPVVLVLEVTVICPQ
jgi:hypothetical protein